MSTDVRKTNISRLSEADKHISVYLRVLISVLSMAVLAIIVYKTGIPNPNMVLVTGLVIFSALFGGSGGLPAAAVMLIYTLFFFSENHSFFTFTEINLSKVYVSLFGIVIITIFVCYLKKSEDDAFNQIEYFSSALKEHNEKLKKASITDTLTSVKNRLALRNDYDLYVNKNVHVMMIDVDGFKNINDTYGHEIGDFVLKQIGQIIIKLFGFEYSYRYGGDEFMIIIPDLKEDLFKKKCEEMMEMVSLIKADNSNVKVSISAGYVYGDVKLNGDLRNMFSQADENLYKVKTNGKNEVIGNPFIAI